MKDEKNTDDTRKNHLPLFGVGPVIVSGQFLITGMAILMSYIFNWSFARIDIMNIPLKVIGVLLIIFGFYMDISAKMKSKLFEKVADNILITDGIYAYVRNPVYGGMFLVCVGAVLIVNNLLLLVAPLICWIYMTLFLIFTEEKWLIDMYGEEYKEYCKKVNRCIPWFKRKL